LIEFIIEVSWGVYVSPAKAFVASNEGINLIAASTMSNPMIFPPKIPSPIFHFCDFDKGTQIDGVAVLLMFLKKSIVLLIEIE
jgi:hypothetical protein